MTRIHATAIVDPRAELADDVEVGPYSIIGPEVVIGAGTWIGPHVVISGPTVIGQRNRIYQFASVTMSFARPARCIAAPSRTTA